MLAICRDFNKQCSTMGKQEVGVKINSGSFRMSTLMAAVLLVTIPISASPFNFRVEVPGVGSVSVGTDGTTVNAGGVTIQAGPVPGTVTVDAPGVKIESPVNTILKHKKTDELVGSFHRDIVEEIGRGYSNVEDWTKKRLTEGESELRKAQGNVEREVRRSAEDIERESRKGAGNIGREAKKVQRGVEEAAVAVYRHSLRELENAKDVATDAERRVREGKVVDALWHLALDPARKSSDSAGQAAMESEVLRVVGNVAASVYGGPAGQAAYAAWLAYYQSGGNLEAAIRVGLIAAVTSSVSQSVGQQLRATPDVPGISDNIKRAAMNGALSGVSVAANGGSPADIQKAFMSTAFSALVQDGYRELEATPAGAKLVQASAAINCMRAVQQSGPGGCPQVNAYVKDAQGKLLMVAKDGVKQWVDLDKEIPGADWVFVSKEEVLDAAGKALIAEGKERGLDLDKLPVKEASQAMKDAVKNAKGKIPDLQGVALFEDRWTLAQQKAQTLAEGVVPPLMVLTYAAATQTITPMVKDAKKVWDEAIPDVPQDMLKCTKGAEALDFWNIPGKKGDTLQCAIGVKKNGEIGADWYAENDPKFCAMKLPELATKYLSEGWSCIGR